ncbi:hypothetical protein [Cohnella caldifontis]|uniref:hypothetical protein n=1 Tax=Cohnella caldifontis TaxID=3027471 RepID=UPI0023ED3B00|nr:hypothetical protein [Cohnella sp. YIM B05605]
MRIRSAAGDIEWNKGTTEELVEIIHQTIKALYDQGQIMQEIHMDGMVIREGFEDFVAKQAENERIKEIVIVSVEEKGLIQEIQSDMTAYLPKLLNALDSISELFYGQMTSDDWSYFTQLVDGIHWFMGAANALRHHLERQERPSPILDALTRFEDDAKRRVAELNEALEQKEYTAAGDQLKYEWPELLQPLRAALNAGGNA